MSNLETYQFDTSEYVEDPGKPSAIVQELQADNAMLREALEWYADRKNWVTGYYKKGGKGEWVSTGEGCCYECCRGCNQANESDTGERAKQALTQSPSTWLQEHDKAIRAEERGRILTLLHQYHDDCQDPDVPNGHEYNPDIEEGLWTAIQAIEEASQ